MAIATPEVYQEMLNRAKEGKFAYPAVNVTSSQTLTAALQGFAKLAPTASFRFLLVALNTGQVRPLRTVWRVHWPWRHTHTR